MNQEGVDYADEKIAEAYDARHSTFRDFEKEAQIIFGRIGLQKRHTIIDIGCGTGAISIPAAQNCKKVHAVDISPAMLKRCRARAGDKGLSNLEYHNAGFLTYNHTGEPADAVITTAAFHHLPDFWKAVALLKMHDMLKPGGVLYIFDIVFTFDVENYESELDAWIGGMRERSGDAMADETVIHVRDEFSTFQWILDGMIQRADFEITNTYSDFPCGLTYVCRKR